MMVETATDKAEVLQTQYLLSITFTQFPTTPKINIHPSRVKKLLDDTHMWLYLVVTLVKCSNKFIFITDFSF